jgi:hypothetical protein
VNSQRFAEYVSILLLPNSDELGLNSEFADRVAVLLMDNYASMKVISFPPHTSHVFESHNVSLCNDFKKKVYYRCRLAVIKRWPGSSNASSIR